MVLCYGSRLASFQFCEDSCSNVFQIPWKRLNFALLAIRRLNLMDEMLFTGSQTDFRNKEKEQASCLSCNIEAASNFVFGFLKVSFRNRESVTVRCKRVTMA